MAGIFPDEDGDDDEERYEDAHAVLVTSFEEMTWIDVDGWHRGRPQGLVFGSPVQRVELVPATEDEVWSAFSVFADSWSDGLALAERFVQSDLHLSAIVLKLQRGGSEDAEPEIVSVPGAR